LLPPLSSSWRHVFPSGDRQKMIALTAFTREGSDHLISLFVPVYDVYSPFADDEGYIVNCEENGMHGSTKNNLSWWLLWFSFSLSHTWGSMMVLQLMVGMSMSPFAKYLQFSHWINIKQMNKDPFAWTALPLLDKSNEYYVIIS
jgi:hypothetical protein